MDEIKLIEPNDELITTFRGFWTGSAEDYRTPLFMFGEKTIETNDISQYIRSTLAENDNIITQEIELARESGDFERVVTRINGMYSTFADHETTTSLLNHRYKEIFQRIEATPKEENMRSRSSRAEILNIIADGGEKNHRYSFATKFCSFIAPDKFPIYDKYVASLIYFYLKNKNYNVNKEDLGIYKYYIEAYDCFKREYKLTKNYKDCDRFLWLYGTTIEKCLKGIKKISFSSIKYNSDHAQNTTPISKPET